MKLQSSGSSATLQSVACAGRRRRDAAVHLAVVRRGDDEQLPVDVAGHEGTPHGPQLQRRELVAYLRRDDGDARAAVEQTLRLLERDPAAADDEHVASAQVDTAT
jgi:hypothetical protein